MCIYIVLQNQTWCERPALLPVSESCIFKIITDGQSAINAGCVLDGLNNLREKKHFWLTTAGYTLTDTHYGHYNTYNCHQVKHTACRGR